jgi:hypothetical protein
MLNVEKAPCYSAIHCLICTGIMAKRQIIEASFDFQLWGINSAMEDYRLCLQMNQYLDWSLKRIDDIEFYAKEIKGFKHFNAYKYINEKDFYTIEVIQNKNSGHFLIPELKNIDLLFLLHGEDDYFDKEAFEALIKKIPGVQSILSLELDTLKSKNNLLIRHFNESTQKKDEDSRYDWTSE